MKVYQIAGTNHILSCELSDVLVKFVSILSPIHLYSKLRSMPLYRHTDQQEGVGVQETRKKGETQTDIPTDRHTESRSVKQSIHDTCIAQ